MVMKLMTIRLAPVAEFTSGRDLTPRHCDLLEEAALQRGDVETLAQVERARRNWDDGRDAVYAILTMGYEVPENEHAGCVPRGPWEVFSG